jgi:hypothetical protein
MPLLSCPPSTAIASTTIRTLTCSIKPIWNANTTEEEQLQIQKKKITHTRRVVTTVFCTFKKKYE